MRNWALPTTQTFFLCVFPILPLLLSARSFDVFRYFSLFITYTPYTIYQCEPPVLSIRFAHSCRSRSDGFKGWGKMILRDGWKCECSPIVPILISAQSLREDFILAACDVEGNFLVVKVRLNAEPIAIPELKRVWGA